MHTELTSRDIYWIAKACWEHHFNWRVLPKAKSDWLIALIAGAIGLIVLVVAAIPDTTDTGVAGVGATLLIIGLCFFLKGQHQYSREKQDFLDLTAYGWEQGIKEIPDTNWLRAFIESTEQREEYHALLARLKKEVK